MPLGIHISISGNFGEIRPDHFHSGIDIRTQGTAGHKVYSIADGYISRIRIQPGGYGKAVYINHPGGITSVYGHLEGFNEGIDQFVKDYQYRQNSHSVDIYPEPDRLPVKNGEFIALSGNSGSSSGPHLHFELRKSGDQVPVNPLTNGIYLQDLTPPKMYSLFVYTFGKNPFRESQPVEYKLREVNGKYSLSSGNMLRISGKSGFGLEVFDKINGNSNSYGIHILELSIDGKVLYLFRSDAFSFEESKYVNAHTDYSMEIARKRSIHLLYRKPNNRLSMYPVVINDGIYEFEAGRRYPVRIRTEDAAGNESVLEFEVEGLPAGSLADADIQTPANIFRWNTVNYFESTDIRLEMPARSLYEDVKFEYTRTDSPGKIYPYLHYIGSPLIPLHVPAKLAIHCAVIPVLLRSKTVIVSYNHKDEPSGTTGIWNGEWLSTRIPVFGKFTIDVDTIPPVLVPLNIKQGSVMNGKSAILFTATDKLTGISEYNGYIDDKWVLFEYDPKNDLISYTFDKFRLKSGVSHRLRFYVRDGTGNQSSFQSEFYW